MTSEKTNKDSLSSIRWQTNPRGFTIPGKYPVATVFPKESLLAQQHESLHYHFNTLTTLGNSICLLVQLAEKCPQLSSIANIIASRWSEALSFKLEGLITYVSYKRARRRDRNVSRESFENMISDEMYRQAWRTWFDKYDALEISDGSKDALAMHVGRYALNMPIYDALNNLNSLDKKENIITEQVINERFDTIEETILSEKAKSLLYEWDYKVQQIYLTSLSEKEKQSLESDLIDKIFKKILPHFDSVPRQKVPESVGLASTWNSQLEKYGYPQECRIDITNKGFIDSNEYVCINPPAPSVAELRRCKKATTIVNILEDNINTYSLCIIYRNNNEDFRLSKKYGRILRQGETYVRIIFGRPTSDLSRCDIVVNLNLFNILKRNEIIKWFSQLNHQNLIITQSAMGDEILEEISEFGIFPQEQIWKFHWNRPMEWMFNNIIKEADSISAIHVSLMTNAKVCFIIVKDDKRRWLDVYPLPREAIEHITSDKIKFIEEKTQKIIEEKMLYSILNMVINFAF